MAFFEKYWTAKPLLIRLIIVNVAVFLLLRLLGIAAMIGGWNIGSVVDFFALPSDFAHLGVMPWTPLTYMFVHYDVLHILFNMLFLYWFGTLIAMLCTQRQIVWLYIYCGIGGAVAFLAMGQVFPSVGGVLMGSSASVMGILVATAVLMPDYEVQLFLIGRLRLKWIAAITVVMFALGLTGDNAGVHCAHFGGMAVGVLFALVYRRGTDITSLPDHAFVSLIRFFRNPRRGRKRFFAQGGPSRRSPDPAKTDRRQLDEILDKIKRSGYGALTPEERARLFDVSKRL